MAEDSFLSMASKIGFVCVLTFLCCVIYAFTYHDQLLSEEFEFFMPYATKANGITRNSVTAMNKELLLDNQHNASEEARENMQASENMRTVAEHVRSAGIQHSQNPSRLPSKYPSQSPSNLPSLHPTVHRSTSPVTGSPSQNPSLTNSSQTNHSQTNNSQTNHSQTNHSQTNSSQILGTLSDGIQVPSQFRTRLEYLDATPRIHDCISNFQGGYADTYNESIAHTQDECHWLCLNSTGEPPCMSYDYSKKASSCRLYAETSKRISPNDRVFCVIFRVTDQYRTLRSRDIQSAVDTHLSRTEVHPIAVFSLHIGETAMRREFIFALMSKWCWGRAMNYTVLHFSENPFDLPEPKFARYAWSLALLQTGKFDWVLYMDTDVVVRKPFYNLKDLYGSDPGHYPDIVVGSTESVPHNSGAWLIRNSKWSEQFLRKFLKYRLDPCKQVNRWAWQDNGPYLHLILEVYAEEFDVPYNGECGCVHGTKITEITWGTFERCLMKWLDKIERDSSAQFLYHLGKRMRTFNNSKRLWASPVFNTDVDDKKRTALDFMRHYAGFRKRPEEIIQITNKTMSATKCFMTTENILNVT